MRILRAILGTLVGYLIFAVTGAALGILSGHDMHATQPLWFIALTAVYGMFFAGLGGVAASRIAPHGNWAVTGMTVLLLAGAVGSLVASPATDASWSQWLAILLMAPSAYFVPRSVGAARGK